MFQRVRHMQLRTMSAARPRIPIIGRLHISRDMLLMLNIIEHMRNHNWKLF